MVNKNIVPVLIVAITTLLLTACGGGTTSNAQQSSSSSTQTPSSPTLSTLDQANSLIVAGAYLRLLSFAKQTGAAIINGEYRAGLVDGSYKDRCEGSKGSFNITVSNDGNKLIQKYDNCLLSITEGGKTDSLLLSGEESITFTHNENGYSVVNITWKNYSVKNNSEPPLAIDGSFIYEGSIYFNSQVSYKNVTAKIKINLRLNDGSETLDAKNVDFVFDYAAILDLYPLAEFGYRRSEPDMLHIFAQTIATAKGSLWINGLSANFSLNTIDQKVTFSNEGIAKGYLDGEPKGFFIQWDKNSDALLDASIFLTETEYNAILDQTDTENNNIYYTRYLNDNYTPYPEKHWRTGLYQPVDLSRGATTEIDVRELFTSKSGALLTYEIDNKSFSTDWEQIEAGRFLLKFPNSNGTEIFILNITATDINGNRSPVIEVHIEMNDNLADFDHDGTPDYLDQDIDNDGVDNNYDSFRKDPAEHSDLDLDGIGDNADDDRDNDGINNLVDAFPSDAACSKPESGDGESCYLTNSRYHFTDKNGIAYFIQEVKDSTLFGKSRFVRFDTINKRFLEPTPTIDSRYVYAYVYNTENHSVIISTSTYNDDLNTHISALFILHLENFTLTSIENPNNYQMYPILVEHGYFVFGVSDPRLSHIPWIEVYDSAGKMISTSENEVRAAPKTEDSYYSLQNALGVAFCDFSVSINSSGEIIKNGQYENRYYDNCNNFVNVSENGIYGFTHSNYSLSLHDVNQNKVEEIPGYSPRWIGNSIVHWAFIDGGGGGPYLRVMRIPSQEYIELHSPEIAGSDLYTSGEYILLTQKSEHLKPARLQLYSEDLQLIYDSAQF